MGKLPGEVVCLTNWTHQLSPYSLLFLGQAWPRDLTPGYLVNLFWDPFSGFQRVTAFLRVDSESVIRRPSSITRVLGFKKEKKEKKQT